MAPGQPAQPVSGFNVHQTALALGSAFLANGMDVKETQVEYGLESGIVASLSLAKSSGFG